MVRKKLISTDEFCVHHNIEFSFIRNLCEFGLLETIKVEKTEFINEDQLEKLERMLRLHRELEINVEGIDTIDHLLDRMHDLQNEVTQLKNRLRLYEDLD
ncbi:chaperone modulator CbpM [Daejeonella sp.]|uniref:chaperone modulator CbpM n=1 Tax=Daejeonella sp. TaxID=2805397 RepID=UPI0030C2C747